MWHAVSLNGQTTNAHKWNNNVCLQNWHNVKQPKWAKNLEWKRLPLVCVKPISTAMMFTEAGMSAQLLFVLEVLWNLPVQISPTLQQ